jgi:hypothetical protein
LQRSAINFYTPISVIVFVRRCIGIQEMPDGSLMKKYDDYVSPFVFDTKERPSTSRLSNIVPLDLCIPWSEYVPTFTKEVMAPSIHEQFPIGSLAVLHPSISGDKHAKLARILSIDGKISIEVEGSSTFPLSLSKMFTSDAVLQHGDMISSMELCRLLSISPLLLSKLTSTFYLYSDQDNSRVNIGLELKYDKLNIKTLHWSDKHPVQGYWLFSKTLVLPLLEKYKFEFNILFSRLEQILHGPRGNDKIYITDVFDTGNQYSNSTKLAPGQSKVAQSVLSDQGRKDLDNLVSWLSTNLPSSTLLEKVNVDTYLMSKKLVSALESFLAIILSKQSQGSSESSPEILKVEPEQLVSPSRVHAAFERANEYDQSSGSFIAFKSQASVSEGLQLGERVLFSALQDKDSKDLPPLGTIGTVIGSTQVLKSNGSSAVSCLVTVLLDKPWIHASSLNGLCSDRRGLIVPDYILTKISPTSLKIASTISKLATVSAKQHANPWKTKAPTHSVLHFDSPGTLVPKDSSTSANAKELSATASKFVPGKYQQVPPPPEKPIISGQRKQSKPSPNVTSEDITKQLKDLLLLDAPKNPATKPTKSSPFIPNQARVVLPKKKKDQNPSS